MGPFASIGFKNGGYYSKVGGERSGRARGGRGECLGRLVPLHRAVFVLFDLERLADRVRTLVELELRAFLDVVVVLVGKVFIVE